MRRSWRRLVIRYVLCGVIATVVTICTGALFSDVSSARFDLDPDPRSRYVGARNGVRSRRAADAQGDFGRFRLRRRAQNLRS